ncbi:MAG TPA: glycosyltransferase family 4 protein [Devosiaceae bacterium]|jgi:glycosyltransferase involved in cell wall biosynthesis
MLQRLDLDRNIHVLITTPSGVTGRGGIDRVMGSLKAELERQGPCDVEASFASTRGTGYVALSLFHTLRFCFKMLFGRLFGRVDVVHINVSSNGSTYRKMVIAWWARLLRIPYVLHLHSGYYHAFWSDRDTLLNRLIRDMFEAAAQVVVLGRVWRDLVAARAPRTASSIVIIPNATEVPSRAHVGGGERVHILFLGRLSDGKGVPQLGAALKNMEQLPGWRATIAGDGEVEAARRKAVELGLHDRVDIPGWVGPDQVATLLAEADILVLPSFIENLPLSVIEGMASGLAIVTTPVGAVEDIITNEETGLLVPPGDVAALTTALTRLVEDPALRTRLGQAAMAVHRERLELAPFANSIRNVWKLAAGRRTR